MKHRLRKLDSRLSGRLHQMHLGRGGRLVLELFAHSGDFYVVPTVLLLLWIFTRGPARALVLPVAASAVLSILVTFIIKYSVKRTRPDGEWGRFYRRTDPYSFPSGHAAKAMSIAATVLVLGPVWAGLPLLLWAGFVGLARVTLGVHYLSDISVGYLVGLAVGLCVGAGFTFLA